MSPINVYAAVPSLERWEAPGRVPVPWVVVEPDPDPDPDPDPVFGIYRDRTNTGLVAAGVSSASFPITTGSTFTTSNTTITRRKFSTMNLVITGNNLIFRECDFDGTVTVQTTSDIKFYDCDLGSLLDQSSQRILVDRCYWSGVPTGGRDGIKVTSDYAQVEDLTVQNSYVGNPVVNTDDHYDGIQTAGYRRMKILGTTLDSGQGGLDLKHHAVVFTQNRSDIAGGRGMINDTLLVEGCHIRSRGVNTLNLNGTNEVYRNNTFYLSGTHRSVVIHPSSTATITSDNNRWFDGALAIPNGVIDLRPY